jgi:hypothetical protein
VEQDNAEGSSRSVNKLTERQREVLIGTLLGDGCLAKHGRFPRLHVKHKSAHRALAELKYEVFRDLTSMALHEFDQKLAKKLYPCVQFATRTSAALSEWHARFYQSGKKIVPKDIASLLTPLALAVWLMDDGASDYAGVTFQTHSFRDSEVEVLVAALESEFELTANSRRNRGGRIIYVQNRSLNRLREIVAPHLLPEFDYKLVERRTRPP